MRWHALLLAATTALATPVAGCHHAGDVRPDGPGGHVAFDPPPPPREEDVEDRPGFFFVHGHWARDPDRWRWRDGHYDPVRPGYTFSEGRWERHGTRYEWRGGTWRTRGNVVIR